MTFLYFLLAFLMGTFLGYIAGFSQCQSMRDEVDNVKDTCPHGFYNWRDCSACKEFLLCPHGYDDWDDCPDCRH